MSSRGTFVLRRLGSVAFKLFAAIDLYLVNCGRMAAKRSAERTAEFENIGRNVVVVSKSGPVETGPTVPVAMALKCDNILSACIIISCVKPLLASLFSHNKCRN